MITIMMLLYPQKRQNFASLCLHFIRSFTSLLDRVNQLTRQSQADLSIVVQVEQCLSIACFITIGAIGIPVLVC